VASLYSQRFYVAQGLNGNGPVITVPAGHRYVIKQLTFYSNPLLAPARGFFQDVASGASLFAGAAATGTPTWNGFYGQLVFDAGDEFRWYVDAVLTDGADVAAFGYDFSS
jgi:hypothetical protein